MSKTFHEELVPHAENVVTSFKAKGYHLATAESCTGGLISAALTAIAGSSDVMDCAFVTYSNQAKMKMVGVPAVLLQQNGAVSDEVARAMAEGALHTANVDVAIAVTGIAGPGGATPDKPVGLVYIALAAKTCPTLVERHVFSGDRAEVRYQTVMRSLTLLNQFAA